MSKPPILQMFDSERFLVIYHSGDEGRGEGVEIADKAAEASLYLHGGLWHVFEAQVEAWKTDTPSIEDVEQFLHRYLALGMHSLTLH